MRNHVPLDLVRWQAWSRYRSGQKSDVTDYATRTVRKAIEYLEADRLRNQAPTLRVGR